MPTHSPGDDQLSVLFDLFVLNQHVRGILARTMDGVGLRPDEYAVYSLVREAGPITPTEMARRLALPPTTISDFVRTMIERRHARRLRHPRDSRSSLIELTARGEAAHRRANAGFERAIVGLERHAGMPLASVAAALRALDQATIAAIADLDAEEAEVGQRGPTPDPPLSVDTTEA